MKSRVEFRGRSGSIYSFHRLDEGAPLKPIGVTLVVAEEGSDGWRVLAADHTNNLAEKGWLGLLNSLRTTHPSAVLLVRLNINRAIREAEAADLAP